MSSVKTIYRVIKNRDFTQISNAMLHDSKMSWKARGLLCTMLSLPDTWDFHRAHLVTLSSEGKDALASGIKELRSLGYLTINDERDERGRIRRWIMEVYETPIDVAAQGVCPEAENPVLDNPNLENPPLSNTKANNNTKAKRNIDHSRSESKNKLDDIFEKMWKAYPLKKAKQAAHKAFIKATEAKGGQPNETLLETICQGFSEHLAEHQARKQLKAQGADVWLPELPHLATWFNQVRWEDSYKSPEELLSEAAPRKGSLLNPDNLFK